jgi:hypothetical protein
MNSHTQIHARPDEKMGRGKLRDKMSSLQNTIFKREANKKRRQRDRAVIPNENGGA